MPYVIVCVIKRGAFACAVSQTRGAASKATSALALAALLQGASAGTANAGSGSVGVSLHFDVAPIEMLERPMIAPETFRRCIDMKERIHNAWSAERNPPVLECESRRDRPLIVDDTTEAFLVVRP